MTALNHDRPELGDPATQRRAATGRMLLLGAVLVIGAVSIAVPVRRILTSRNDPDPMAALATALRTRRSVEARIARFDYAPHRSTTRSQGESPDLDLLAAAAGVEEAFAGRNDAAALHAMAVAHLAAGRSEKAIALLQRALVAKPGEEMFSDLAAAYLARGGERADISDFVAAFEAAESALARNAGLAPAAFNRALSLEAQVFLRSEAMDAWDAYLQLDSASPWAAEATRHKGMLAAVQAPFSSKQRKDAIESAINRGNYDELTVLARSSPEEARNVAEETLLPSWAEAWREGSRESVGEGIRTIARALAQRGDFWVQDLCSAIDAATVLERTRIAEGVEALARARVEYLAGRYDYAKKAVAESETLLNDGLLRTLPQLIDASICYVRRDMQSFPLTMASVQALDARRHPSLVARVEWLAGLNAGVSGRPFEAHVALVSAANRLATVGEKESAAGARGFAAQALELLGETERSWQERLRAAEELASVGASPQRVHTGLFVLAEAAQRRGAQHYAKLLSTVLLERAGSEDHAERAVDALLIKASAEAALGDAAGAAREMDEASRLARGIADVRVRDRTLLFVERAALTIFSSTYPARALRAGQDALARARSLHDRMRTAEIGLALAKILRAMRQPRDAEHNLRAALSIIDRTRGTVTEDELRLSYADTAGAVVDELVDLLIAEERAEEALNVLVEARNAELRRRLGISSVASAARHPGAARLTLFYAVLERQTILWTLRGGARHDASPPGRPQAPAAARRRFPPGH